MKTFSKLRVASSASSDILQCSRKHATATSTWQEEFPRSAVKTLYGIVVQTDVLDAEKQAPLEGVCVAFFRRVESTTVPFHSPPLPQSTCGDPEIVAALVMSPTQIGVCGPDFSEKPCDDAGFRCPVAKGSKPKTVSSFPRQDISNVEKSLPGSTLTLEARLGDTWPASRERPAW